VKRGGGATAQQSTFENMTKKCAFSLGNFISKTITNELKFSILTDP
jgi:hypothetical protein